MKIYNATKINTNLHSSTDSSYFEADGDFVNPRTFEIMACGGFQLVDRRLLLPELFVEGEDIVTFSSLNDLREKIDYYLNNETERIRIAQNGQWKVLNSHTYRNRIEKMIQIIQEKIPKFTNSILKEKSKTEEIIAKMDDPELAEFLRSLSPEKVNSLPDLIAEVRKHKGRFKNYEVILLSLETFLKH